MLKLKIGWEGQMRKQHNHKTTCKCGCRDTEGTVASKIKELTKLLANGQATMED